MLDYISIDEIAESLDDRVIAEGLALNAIVQMLTGGKSKWRDKTKDPSMIRQWVKGEFAKIDPTGENGKYGTFIAQQLAAGDSNIVLRIRREEDAERLKRVLEWFVKESSRGSWGGLVVKYLPGASEMSPTEAANRYANIHNFKSWRDVEVLMGKVEGSRKDESDEPDEAVSESGNYRFIYELKVGPDHFKVYEVLEPEGFIELGVGSNWCTSHISKADQWDFTYPGWHKKAGVKRQIKAMADPETAPKDAKTGKPIIYPAEYTASYYKDKHWVVALSEDGGPFRSYWQFGGTSFCHLS